MVKINLNNLPTIGLNINSKQEKFKLLYSVCQDPDCDCNGIIFSLVDELNHSINFFIGLEKVNLRDENFSNEEKEIISSFIEFIKSPKNDIYGLDFFKNYYTKVKAQAKIKNEALDSFEPGELMPYLSIFGEEDNIKVNIGNKDYEIIDQYCVMPNCLCSDAVLNFFEEVYHVNRIKKPYFSLRYDYIKQTIEDTIGIEEAELNNFREELLWILDNKLSKKFKIRHKKLKKEVLPYIEEKIKDYKEEDHKRKLGRNELCHCGSGKKYKKCCLFKDIEEYGAAIKI